MNRSFLFLLLSTSFSIASADWSRLQMCGANISGLIARTHEIMEKCWPPFRSEDCQMTPSTEELSIVINFVAAMRCEEEYHELPHQISIDLGSAIENLSNYFDKQNLLEQVKKKQAYYDFFIKDPNIQTPFEGDRDTLAKLSQWREQRTKLQAKEATLYQSSTDKPNSHVNSWKLPLPLAEKQQDQESRPWATSSNQPNDQRGDLRRLLTIFPMPAEAKRMKRDEVQQIIGLLRSEINVLNSEIQEKKILLARALALLDSAQTQNSSELPTQEQPS